MKTSTSDPPKPFHLDLNLDDEVECREFYEKHHTIQGQELADQLGLQGDGAAKLATSLILYANDRIQAFNYRVHGYIVDALRQERNCDFIYRTNIQPVCDCW